MQNEMRTYHGSCHCGAVQFEVATTLTPAVRCNCSLCKRKGTVMVLLPEAQFRLTAGADALTLYQFNSRLARHWFCKTCGIYTHHVPRTMQDKVAINAGCLDDVDALALETRLVDGASLSVVDPV
jgi:hypothetical protein